MRLEKSSTYGARNAKQDRNGNVCAVLADRSGVMGHGRHMLPYRVAGTLPSFFPEIVFSGTQNGAPRQPEIRQELLEARYKRALLTWCLRGIRRVGPRECLAMIEKRYSSNFHSAHDGDSQSESVSHQVSKTNINTGLEARNYESEHSSGCLWERQLVGPCMLCIGGQMPLV